MTYILVVRAPMYSKGPCHSADVIYERHTGPQGYR